MEKRLPWHQEVMPLLTGITLPVCHTGIQGMIKTPVSGHYPGLKETKCYSLITQTVFPIYLTIREIVFIIRIIELKSVFLRSKTSMRPATPGTLIGTLPMKPTCIAYTNTFLYNFH